MDKIININISLVFKNIFFVFEVYSLIIINSCLY